jgi:8-oxo-dGTP pyrophosphatase MutT (NUDIX family)
MTTERKSYGVICIRRVKGPRNIYQALMVRKKHTYSLILFVNGQYSVGNYVQLSQLVGGMTLDERALLLTLNYEYIWRSIYFGSKRGYICALRKYEETMQQDRFVKLLKHAPQRGYLRWEIPKGKKQDVAEPDVQAACREFCEETGAKKEQFRLLPDITRQDSYVDNGVRYTTLYFGAIGDFLPDAMHCYLNETTDVRWMDLEELRVTDRLGHSHMASILRPMLRILRPHIRD